MIEIVGIRICANLSCKDKGIEKPLTTEFFYFRKRGEFDKTCKECRKEQERENHLNNRERDSKRQKEYDENHKEENKKKVKNWSINHSEQVKKLAKKWSDNHQKELKKYRKEYNIKKGIITGKGQSIAEKQIECFLKDYNIKFEAEKTFNDCRNKRNELLSFDFYLPELNILIEFDGFLHFKSVWPGQLEKFQIHDQIKTNYCLIKEIQLIRIKEGENIENCLNESLLLIKI